jgi:hypothetical protein
MITCGVGVAVRDFIDVCDGEALTFDVVAVAVVVVVFVVVFAETFGLVSTFVVGLVQPATSKEATTSDRTTIAAIGFNCICLCKWRMWA